MNEESVFQEALSISSPEERQAYLDRVCGDDAELRARVEALLRSDELAGSFLERPAPELDRTVNVNRGGMDAGLAAAFGADAAVIMGGAGHSVLKSLSKHLPDVPHVTLHDSREDRGAVVQPASPELPGKQDDSRYQLHGEIARGGMGAIIKGRDTDLGRDLAIKVLLDSHKEKPEVIQRFIEEAQIGGQLQHPGIVPVYELGQFGDQRPFFSMKLVKGQTLAAILSKRKDPSQDHPHLLGIFEQVCQTMAYAHSKGVIHRDLKPANVMVGAFGEVQVMDWGLSKVLSQGGVADEQKSLEKHRDVSVIETRRSTGSDGSGGVGSQTQMGSVMGTPAYMPPEQALGEVDRLDERADVFGLGAILTEILTGKPPYVADDSTQVFRMASRGKLDDCFTRLDSCGAERELTELAKTALSTEPDGRMTDAGELAEQITRYLEGVQERLHQVELARIEAQARSEEERRRKKLYLAIAGLMLLLAVGGAVGAVRFQALAIEKEKQREDAENARVVARRGERFAKAVSLAAQSSSLRDQQPVQSALLAIESLKATTPEIPAARTALLNSTRFGGVPLLAHDYVVKTVAISPDSRWLVTGAIDTARVWDLKSAEPASSSRILSNVEKANVQQLVCLPDSRRVLTGNNHGLRMWDLFALPGSPPLYEFAFHKLQLRAAVVSPDGRWLAVGSREGSVLVWDLDADDPSQLRYQLEGHESWISSLAFSPDSGVLATACYNDGQQEPTAKDTKIRLWNLDADDPGAAAKILQGHTDEISQLAFGPDGNWLVSASRDQTARVWKLDTQESVLPSRVLSGHTNALTSVAISSNGRWVATASEDATAWLWSMEDGGDKTIVLTGHRKPINRVTFGPRNRWLATSSLDHTTRLWDLDSDNVAQSAVILRGHGDEVTDVAFSPDGLSLTTVSRDKTARLWDLTLSNPANDQVYREHREAVRAVLFSPDARWLVSAALDETVRLWQLVDGEPSGPPIVLSGYRPNASFVRGIRVSPDSRWLAAVGDRGVCNVWDLKARDISTSRRELRGHAEPVWFLAFSPDSRWLASTSKDQSVRLWDLSQPDPVPGSLTLQCDNSLTDVAISPDSKWLAVGANGFRNGKTEPSVRVWDFQQIVTTSQQTPKVPVHEFRPGPQVNSLSFDRTSQYLVAGTRYFGSSAHAIVYDLHTEDPSNAVRDLVGLEGTIIEVGVTPSGFITTGWNSNARRWKFGALGGEQKGDDLRGHTTNLTSQAISPDGCWLVTGGTDNTARVWDLSIDDPTNTQLVLRGHESAVSCVAISPDARWVVTGGLDGTVQFWDLDVDAGVRRARRLAGRELAPEDRRQFSLSLQTESPAQ